MTASYGPGVVQFGDCCYKGAKEHGFVDAIWGAWDHHLNAGCRAKRQRPNVLRPGDVQWIPVLAERHGA